MMTKKCLLVLLATPLLTGAFTQYQLQNDHRVPMAIASSNTNSNGWQQSVETIQKTGAAIALMTLLTLAPTTPAWAAKTLDIAGQDFSGQDYSNRDFTKANAKGANFHNANLQGSIFAGANLVNADFSGADLRGADFADATLDGAIMKDAQAQEAVFSASILDVADMENIDLTKSLWPSKLRIMICDMDELKGKNPVTGVDSKDSIQCTDIMYKS
mmetsp:Transcript_32834/g.49527  ORF Transcript_32834/g.49527 Transcript_32834/m.49527 type:complete len:215 (+) Transcript_32834:128-772(+)